MRVLHVYKTYLPDTMTGVTQVIHTLAKHGPAHGIENTVFCLSKTPTVGRVAFENHEIRSAPVTLDVASTPLSWSGRPAFVEEVERADLVHYHFPWPVMDFYHLMSARNKPSVVTYHSDVVKQRAIGSAYRYLRAPFLNSMDAIVATSPNYVASSAVLRPRRDDVTVIPIGIDPPPAELDAALLVKWRTRLPEPFFLFVGAFRYYKGLPYLLLAARQSGLNVVLAGEDADREALNDVPSNVTVVGRVSDAEKWCLLSLCHAFVLPSHLRSEAFGVSLLEAAFSAKPMISCEIGTGTTFVNINGETGIAVPPADPTALAEAMNRLLGDPSMAQACGQNARRRAQTHFTASAMAERYAALYRDAIAAKKAKRFRS
ncbi:MAG: glycosyltransferase [Pseudomonadota bacterium]